MQVSQEDGETWRSWKANSAMYIEQASPAEAACCGSLPSRVNRVSATFLRARARCFWAYQPAPGSWSCFLGTVGVGPPHRNHHKPTPDKLKSELREIRPAGGYAVGLRRTGRRRPLPRRARPLVQMGELFALYKPLRPLKPHRKNSAPETTYLQPQADIRPR